MSNGAEDYTNHIIRSQRNAIDKLTDQVTIMRQALLLIEGWHMPYKGFAMDQGSNGERDYVREVARNAITKAAM